MAKIGLRAYNREIEQLIERGQVDEAIAHSKYILRFFPKHIETYRLLGKAYIESQRYSEAADILQRILSVLPDDFVSQIGMSIIREDEGNLDAAIFHMERAHEIQPSNVAVQDELRRLYGRRDGVEPPRLRLTRGALVRLYAKGDLYRQAIAEIRAALAEDPNRFDLEVILARMYHLQGQKVEATEVASRLVTKLPYCFEANRVLADVLPSTSRAEDAKIYQQRVFVLDPYMAYISPNAPTSNLVPDNAVTLDRLDWQPVAAGVEQPAWAQNAGVSFEAEEEVETTPEWLSTAPGAGQPVEAAQEAENIAPAAAVPSEIPAVGENEIPEWMQEAGWGPSAHPGAETAQAESGEEEPAIVAGEIPDWLKGMAPPSESAAGREEENKLEWLDQILPPAETAAPAAEVTGAVEVPFAEEISPAGLPVEAEAEPVEPLPDWLTFPEEEAPVTKIAPSEAKLFEEEVKGAPVQELAEAVPAEEVVQAIPTEEVSEVVPAEEVTELAPAQEVTEAVPAEEEGMIVPVAEMPEAAPAEEMAEAAPSAEVVEAVPAEEEGVTVPVAEISEVAPIEEMAEAAPAAEVVEAVPAEEEGVTVPVAEVPKVAPIEEMAEAAPAAEVVEAVPAEEEGVTVPVAEVPEVAPVEEMAEAAPAAEVTEVVPAEEEGITVPAAELPEVAPAEEIAEAVSSEAEVTEVVTSEEMAQTIPAQEAPAVFPEEEIEFIPAESQAQAVAQPEEIEPAAAPSAEIETISESPAEEKTQPIRVTPVQTQAPPPETEIPAAAPAEAAQFAEFLPEAPSDEAVEQGSAVKEEALPGEPVSAATGQPDMNDIDAAMAWLESLAAKQGAEEATLFTTSEERLATPPEWVSEEMAKARVEGGQEFVEEPAAEISSDIAEITVPEAVQPSVEETAVELPAETTEVEIPAAAAPGEVSEPVSEVPVEMTGVTPPEMEESIAGQPEAPAGESALPEDQYVTSGKKTAPLGEAKAAVPPGEMDEEAAFAWLETLAANQGADEGTLITPEAERSSTAPAWVLEQASEGGLTDASDLLEGSLAVSELEKPEVKEEKPAVVETPPAGENIVAPETPIQSTEPGEWGRLQPEAQAVESTPPIEEPVAEAETPAVVSEEPLPSWLQEFEPVSEAPVKEVAPASEEDLPEWLKGFETPAEAPITQASDESISVTSWLNQHEAHPGAKEETAPAVQAQEEILPEPIAPEPALSFLGEAAPPREIALSENPQLAQAQTDLRNGQIDSAVNTFNQLIEQGQFLDEIIRNLQESLYKYPVEISLWQTLGDAYMRGNRIQEALDAYTKAEDLLK